MLGIDVVDVERLRRVLQRSPRAEEKLFTKEERSYCRAMADPVVHFAGTLAAKEAVIKAAGLGALVAWAQRIEIARNASGAPSAHVAGRPATAAVTVSIAHDGGVAVAVALAGEPSELNQSRAGNS